jgi:tRNA(Arg) A34 adenosine deaminase TadA
VGAALSRGNDIVSEGRNRVYDEAGGTDPLQRTAIAHAEMNAITSARDADLAECALWSTHEPCIMCAGAAVITEIAAVHYLATDPSSGDTPGPYRSSGPTDPIWTVVANVLFLHNVAWVAGRDSPMLERNRDAEYEVTSLAIDLVADEALIAVSAPAEFTDAIAGVWPRISAAAQRRQARLQTAQPGD